MGPVFICLKKLSLSAKIGSENCLSSSMFDESLKNRAPCYINYNCFIFVQL